MLSKLQKMNKLDLKDTRVIHKRNEDRIKKQVIKKKIPIIMYLYSFFLRCGYTTPIRIL